jgi:nitroreductase
MMIDDLMNKRSSVRAFEDRDIPDEIIQGLLESARKAPSGGNEQPYIFGVIKNKGTIQAISECAYGQKWISGAALIIAFCVRIGEDDKGARLIQKQRFPRYEREIDQMDKSLYTCLNLEEHQSKIPASVMMLRALESDVYSTWISRFDLFKVKEMLKLPPNVYPSELMAFGYAKGEVKHLKKKEAREITFYESFI